MSLVAMRCHRSRLASRYARHYRTHRVSTSPTFIYSIGLQRTQAANSHAADNASGVQSSYYKIDGGATVTYSTPFSVSSVGTHAINFWSIDLAGNTEVQRLLSLKIDNTVPTVTVKANPTQGGHGNKPLNVTISGQVADTISGVGPVTYSVLDEYGITQPSGPVTVQANGNYSFTLSLPATKNPGDNNGHLYTITIRASF